LANPSIYNQVSQQKWISTISLSIDQRLRKCNLSRLRFRLIRYRWSAVVRGAALYGIDKTRLKNYVKTERYPDYYAVAQDTEETQGNGLAQYQDQITGKTMGKNRLTWIVRRGDLAFEDWNQSQETLLAFNFREHDEKNFTISIYKYLRKDNILPTRARARDPRKYTPSPKDAKYSQLKIWKTSWPFQSVSPMRNRTILKCTRVLGDESRITNALWPCT